METHPCECVMGPPENYSKCMGMATPLRAAPPRVPPCRSVPVPESNVTC